MRRQAKRPQGVHPLFVESTKRTSDADHRDSGIATFLYRRCLAVIPGAKTSLAKSLRAHDRYGFIDVKTDAARLHRFLEQGFQGIKNKVGIGSVAQDMASVGAVWQLIGPDIVLMLDFNQSMAPAEAIYRTAKLSRFDLYWAEEPVSAQDLYGHAAVRASTDVPVQTGKNWWFPRDMQRAISANASGLGHGGHHENRWRHRLDGSSCTGRRGFFATFQLYLRRSQFPYAGGCAYLRLAGVPGFCRCDPGTTLHRDRWHSLRLRPGLGISWDEAAVARYAVQ